MKSAAAEAGIDASLVERAARLLPDPASRSLFETVVGGPLRHEDQATFPSELTEHEAARLLSAVRSAAGRPGKGDSSSVGMSWHSGTEGSELLVTAHAEADGTRVSARIDRGTGLLLTSLATAGGIFASILVAIGAAEEATISPYLVLGGGVAGTLALARAYWASSTRRMRRQLGDIMDTIRRSLAGRGGDEPRASEPLPKANLAEKLSQIAEHWTPRLAARVNDTDVKLVKLQGEFVWHHHENEDELFLVVKGRMLMQFRDREEWVDEGEFILVPRGVEHRPVAPAEVHVLLIEPTGTLNTGNVRDERTVDVVEPV
jgi:mannose-6-phosphate isomerase-like protein (cupin superfamily)